MAEQFLFDFEEWRKCNDWPDYEVSSFGRVRRRTDSRDPRYKAGFILKPTPNQDGYLCIRVGGRLAKTTLRVHWLVCKAFNGEPPPDRPEAAHWDGVLTNNRASNLRWATHAENMADLRRHGKHRGEIHRDAKLTEQDVRQIRQRLKSGEGSGPIARDYGVSFMSIKQIRIGRSWGWLPD